MLIILVPVIFGFMGFAVDLGRLYMIRHELKSAANAIALAAAEKLNGSDAAASDATIAAQTAQLASAGIQNRFDYGSIPLGQTEGRTTSTVADPEFFDTVAGATGGDGGAVGSGSPKHVRITITAQAPLLFWRFLSLAAEGTTQVSVQSVAGQSAPLCTACNIETMAIAALDSGDTADYGFVAGTRYTLGFVCNGANQPGPLAGSTQRIPYLMINRMNADATIFTGDDTQAYRIGAAGLPSSSSEAVSCVKVDAVETIWQTAAPLACPLPANPGTVPAPVRAMLCGMTNRFEAGVFSGCEAVAESDTVSNTVTPDTDTTDLADLASYTGNGRRILNIAVVDSLADSTALTVLGFRQFIVEPVTGNTNLNPTDQNGRFDVLYVGSVAPIRQGRFSGCSVASGPGKVVLHQ
ncbi:MAG: pilus assembly protein TadG-related protein [Bryobacteraceae bacterium]